MPRAVKIGKRQTAGRKFVIADRGLQRSEEGTAMQVVKLERKLRLGELKAMAQEKLEK